MKASRSLTVATALLAAGFMFQAHPVDVWIDEKLPSPLPEHAADLAHVLAIMSACVLLGLIPLRKPAGERWRRPWIGFGVASMAVAVVASRFGARELAGADLYQNVYAALVVSSCTLIAVTTVRQLDGARLLMALTVAAVAALASAAFTIYTSIKAPALMVEHYDQILTITSIPVALGVGTAGLYGLWRAQRRRRQQT